MARPCGGFLQGTSCGGCTRGLAQVLVVAAFCKGRHARTEAGRGARTRAQRREVADREGTRGASAATGAADGRGTRSASAHNEGLPRAGRRTERHPKRHEQGAGPTHARVDLEKTAVSYSFLATKARGPDRTENCRPMTCGFPKGLKPFALARPKNYRKRRLLSFGAAPSRQSGPSKAARSTRPFLATEPTPSCTLSH